MSIPPRQIHNARAADVFPHRQISHICHRQMSIPPRHISHICHRQMSIPPRHLWRGGGRQAGGEVRHFAFLTGQRRLRRRPRIR